MFAYAQASLLHYARWLLTHERPYLDHPELLEYPTETWAAQDIRKADVCLWAALHCKEDERERFLDRARFFFDYSVTALMAATTRHFTRPVALMLSNGFRYGWFQQHSSALPAPSKAPQSVLRAASRFEPQKTIALRRAKWLAVTAFIGVVLAFALFIMTAS